MMTEIEILPIWTLGDPHSVSRIKSVTTKSSFIVVVGPLAQCHTILRSRSQSNHYLHHTQRKIIVSVHIR